MDACSPVDRGFIAELRERPQTPVLRWPGAYPPVTMGTWLERDAGLDGEDRASCVDLLEAAGLWSWLDRDAAVAMARNAKAGASPVLELIDHGWTADGEDLAEGEVGTLLAAAGPALAREGVVLSVETLHGPYDQGSPGYTIRINDEDIELYRFDPSEPGLPISVDPWMDCTTRPLHRVNDLLQAVGSGRRMVVFFPGGNDGTAFLLPETAIELLQVRPEIPGAERPLVP